MNKVEELKRFASVHSKLQDLPSGLWQQVLDRIEHDGEGKPGSWAYEWSAAGRTFQAEDDPLSACRCFTMARFPFVDGPARESALRRTVETFNDWRRAHPRIEGLDLEVGATEGTARVRCWASGLSPDRSRPLLLFMGGIVSVKEQWAPLLLMADELQMAMVVTEMPGVGENTLPYDEASWRMLPAILDALADRADVAHTFAMANSFSGHLALRCALEDRRLRGVISNAAPISDFFTDTGWQGRLPKVTVDTLAHLLAVEPGRLPERLAGWALTEQELAALDIPVAYLASLHDEICPPTEVERLRQNVRRLSTKVFDDVHASPSHLEETRMFLFGSLARMRGEEI